MADPARGACFMAGVAAGTALWVCSRECGGRPATPCRQTSHSIPGAAAFYPSSFTHSLGEEAPPRSPSSSLRGGADFDATGGAKETGPANRLLRKVETVVQRRTSRVLLVIERTNTTHNYSACLRTAEAMGIQHVWCVDPPSFEKDAEKRASQKKKKQWQDDKEVRHFMQLRGAMQRRDTRACAGAAPACGVRTGGDPVAHHPQL